MNNSHKLLFNTAALYVRIIVSAIVAIVSTKIVLKVLGVDSYGLYNLIAGLMVLLSFLNGALMISTQRFLSFTIGEGNKQKLNDIFNVSFIIHFCIGLSIASLLKIIQPLLFGGFLKIPPNLVGDAIMIYNIMILTSFFTIIMIPYSAVLNAREDMVFFAGAEIFSLLFRLLAAVVLLYLDNNLLITYTWLMLLALVINVLLKYIRCLLRYKEIKLSLNSIKQKYVYKEMIGFIGWNTLGSLAVLVRNQGIAVLLNVFFGTTINAAHGVATQVNALVLSFAMALTNVFAPSIIRNKGEGNNHKMLQTAIFSSKLSFLLSSAVALPLLVYTPFILDLWLDVIPIYTVDFCRLIIIGFLITQLIPGINRAIYAEGDIKKYQIYTFLIMSSIIPIGYGVIKFISNKPQSVFIVLLCIQISIVVLTIFYGYKLVGLLIKKFIFNSVFKPLMVFSIIFSILYFLNKNIELTNLFLILFSSVLFSLVYIVVYIHHVFDNNEKNKLRRTYKSLLKKCF